MFETEEDPFTELAMRVEFVVSLPMERVSLDDSEEYVELREGRDQVQMQPGAARVSVLK